MKDFYIIALLGLLLSLAAVVLVMPIFIKVLKNHNINQSVSEYALDEYKKKEKTPIMGGLLFVVLPLIVFFVIDPTAIKDEKTLMIVISFVSFCLVGFIDDLLIIIRKDNNGLSPKIKLIMEFIFVVAIYFIFRESISNSIAIPFINGGICLPWYIFLPFMILLYLAEANAVNFTDGMDGLCAGVSLIALVPFVIFTFIAKNYHSLMLILCVIGGLIGYLFFNFYPARIFMGDSGSLALGGLFASLAISLDAEILLFVIGGVFVWEMFCVCLQLTCVKLFKKRVFSYTPIHYAFVLKGKKETKVVSMFYIIGLILAIIGTYIGLK